MISTQQRHISNTLCFMIHAHITILGNSTVFIKHKRESPTKVALFSLINLYNNIILFQVAGCYEPDNFNLLMHQMNV